MQFCPIKKIGVILQRFARMGYPPQISRFYDCFKVNKNALFKGSSRPNTNGIRLVFKEGCFLDKFIIICCQCFPGGKVNIRVVKRHLRRGNIPKYRMIKISSRAGGNELARCLFSTLAADGRVHGFGYVFAVLGVSRNSGPHDRKYNIKYAF